MLVFFMTTIDGAAEKWERYGAAMKAALNKHDTILDKEIRHYGGRIIKHTGDGFFAVFEDGMPLHCAHAIQEHLRNETWKGINTLSVAIGIHQGEAEKRGEDYFGITVNRTARIMSAAWGGQTLLSKQAADQCDLPPGAVLQDLGVHVLRDLGEPQQIFQLLPSGPGTREFPPIRSLSNHPHSLPAQTTPFIGRVQEIRTITRLLVSQPCRLVSLVGSGGIGKTRLALQAGAEMIGSFPHGVFFVPLDGLTVGSIQFLVFTIADAIRFTLHGKQNPEVQLLNYLQEKNMLIIMDNFEHLVEESMLLTKVFAYAPHIKFLVTSRERLNLSGEIPIEVTGFACPDSTSDQRFMLYPSVQLFVQSAHRADPGFILQDTDRQAVIRICHHVEGIPLGIELAASWVRALTCEEIDAEIDKGMDFLTSTLRDVPKRHRSLRSVFNYSWDLLSKKEQKICQRLAVFEGGCTVHAAGAIAQATLGDLASLADKSLLHRHISGRYEMKKLLRQYAREKIESDQDEYALTKTHSIRFFAGFLQERLDSMDGKEQIAVFNEIAMDFENIRNACQWAIDINDIESLKKISPTLFAYYDHKAWFKEGKQVFTKFMRVLERFPHSSMDADEQLFYGKTVFRLGRILRRLGRYEDAGRAFTQSIVVFKRLNAFKDMNFVLLQQAIIALRTGDLEHARTISEQVLEESTREQEKNAMAQALTNLGVIAYYQGNYEQCRVMHREALTIRLELGQLRAIAAALNNLANITDSLGDKDEARRLYEQSLEINKAIDNRSGLSIIYGNLGEIHQGLGDIEKSQHYFELSLDLARQIGDPEALVNSLQSMGYLYVQKGDHDRAQQIFRETLRIAQKLNARPRIITSLDGIASMLKARGEDEQAARMCLGIIQQERVAPEVVTSVNQLLGDITS
ncbi:tetratricopeptide repeat protein, partial [candidate division WOR-3 bacterium]|nr:tetratricopeptide repeat protein [candidate division WOR-3 bacterium]